MARFFVSAYCVKCRAVGLAAIVSLSVMLAAACSKKQAPAHEGPIALGTYRATLKLPGGELPFGLELVRENGECVAYLMFEHFSIHKGFSGLGTGAHYQKLIEDFDATVEQLLAETGENTAETQADDL